MVMNTYFAYCSFQKGKYRTTWCRGGCGLYKQ